MKIYFLDEKNIEESDNTYIVFNKPFSYDNVLEPKYNWESYYYMYFTVLEYKKLYYMFYRAQPHKKYISSPFEGYMCLAISNDGIKWDKPSLGIYDFKGSKNNNILYGDPNAVETSETVMFLDKNPETSHIFKAVCKDCFVSDFGTKIHTSNNGINWNIDNCLNVFKFHIDAPESVFWDYRIQKYVIYVRSFNLDTPYYNNENFREWKCISRIEMDDIEKPWENIKDFTGYYYRYANTGYKDVCLLTEKNIDLNVTPEMIKKHYNIDDDCLVNLYNCNVYQYQHNLYFMFLNVSSERLSEWYTNSDIIIMYSNNGIDWEFLNNKHPYISYSDIDDNIKSLYMGQGTIINKDILQYCIGQQKDHYHLAFPKNINKSTPDDILLERDAGTYYVCKQRIDGFSSLYSNKGYAILNKCFLKNSDIFINYKCSGFGYIQIELLDENKNIIDGFSKDNCQTVVGDNTNYKIIWNNNNTINDVFVYIKIYINNAEIYSLTYY